MLDTLDCTGSEAHSPGYKRFVPFSGSFGFGMKDLRVFPLYNSIVKSVNDRLKWWLHKWQKGSGSTPVIDIWTCYFRKWCSTLEWKKIMSCFVFFSVFLLQWNFCCRYKTVTSLSPRWNFQQAYLEIFFILEPRVFTIIFQQSRTFIYICWSWLLGRLLIRR